MFSQNNQKHDTICAWQKEKKTKNKKTTDTLEVPQTLECLEVLLPWGGRGGVPPAQHQKQQWQQ